MDAREPRTRRPHAGEPWVIMPLGDSITQGAGSREGGGYRVPLFRLARRDGHSLRFVGDAEPNGPAMVDGVPFPAAHEGHGGFTIDPGAGPAARPGISPLVEAAILRHQPDVITLMIGTNDVALGVEHLATRLGQLVDRIFAADSAIAVLLAQIIPTSSATHNAHVRAYNVAVADVARSRAAAGKHVRLVDAYSPMVEAPGFPASVLADELHPNDAGYAIIAQSFYDALRPLLIAQP